MTPLCHSPRGCQERCCRLPLEDLSSRIGVVIRSKVLSLGPSSSSLSAGRSFCDERQPQASLLCGSEPGSSGVCVGLPVPRSEPVGRRLSLYNFMVISILFLTLLEDSHSSCLSAVIVSCLNRRGSQTPTVNHVMIAIFSLVEKNSWHLPAVHLEGVRNVITGRNHSSRSGHLISTPSSEFRARFPTSRSISSRHRPITSSLAMWPRTWTLRRSPRTHCPSIGTNGTAFTSFLQSTF